MILIGQETIKFGIIDMKQLLSILFIMALFTTQCQAQFGGLDGLLRGVKAANDARKAKKKAQEAWGNTKVKDIHSDVTIDTASVEYKNAVAEARQRMYENNPELKKLMEMQGDTVAMKKYYEEKYGGMSQEEITKKVLKEAGSDYDSKDFQDAYAKVQKMSGFQDDPVFKKIMAEQRQPTMQEATYLNEKYGTTFEYEGIETFKDSIGVYANMNGSMKPMMVTNIEKITEERPIPDFGQETVKKYVQDWKNFLKNPFADRVIVDSVQNYVIYNHRHADEQFDGVAKFTFYSNLELKPDLTVNDLQRRKVSDFMEPIDPKNIFVFKVHKGIGCRFMEYMYSKISYKESELHDYVSDRLINGGYIDANIENKLSDEDLFKAMMNIESQFMLERLLQNTLNQEKFYYTNVIPEAKNVKITTKSRKIGHVTALDVTIDAKPGEYAFIIRNPDVDEYFKQIVSEEEDEKWRKRLEGFEVSVLAQGAYFFSIK